MIKIEQLFHYIVHNICFQNNTFCRSITSIRSIWLQTSCKAFTRIPSWTKNKKIHQARTTPIITYDKAKYFIQQPIVNSYKKCVQFVSSSIPKKTFLQQYWERVLKTQKSKSINPLRDRIYLMPNKKRKFRKLTIVVYFIELGNFIFINIFHSNACFPRFIHFPLSFVYLYVSFISIIPLNVYLIVTNARLYYKFILLC